MNFEGGTYSFIVDGETVDNGTYQIVETPYRIALTPETGDEACGPTEYQFALSLETDVLFLEGLGDVTCDSMQALAERDLPPINNP
ncbi:MAG: hypothetical protein WAL25_01885 [Acidimicrobiia bacterium]